MTLLMPRSRSRLLLKLFKKRFEPGEPSAGFGEVGSSSLVVAERSFPPAAQPEIMRAAEKDDHYASYGHDACRDAIRHLFGTRAAVAYQREDQSMWKEVITDGLQKREDPFAERKHVTQSCVFIYVKTQLNPNAYLLTL
ncbi:Peroxisome biogenesis factor 10 domain-containing protein [Dioscorea alata]|uniref:Peroxisome biogenesis factor 10 domain-containing protein n=1 Tax=Dioscorea alata TaxID=55571 RepID=A0ACB7UHN7_DIOAL|nr:Peroxisome biogenesis factor 10 domain-containing protein [Dioscorea alata]